MNAKENFPLIAAGGLGVLAVLVFAIFLKWDGLSFSIKPQDLLTLMSPLLLAAGFIERAVEVLVSPWRDAGAAKLQKAEDAAKAANPQVPADIKKASDDLDDYRGVTQRYAFGTSLTLGFAVAIAGVRTLYQMLDPATKYGSASPAQRTFFMVVDVVLTAALLAGGADGIHSVVNAFTGFFDATATKNAKAAAS